MSFGSLAAVRDVSFDIPAGACVAIVGESGSGKSVTARTLLGLAGRGARVSGSIRFDGVEVTDASPRSLRTLRGRDIGFVSQGALVALDPLRTVGREIADALRIHTNSTARQRQDRVNDLLDSVGMPAFRANQRPDELSGGLRQRAIIASAIAAGPRLLIADEPTTALDATVTAGILDLLGGLRDAGTAILLISHDLSVVSRLASHVVVMREGVVVESGSTQQVLREPRHPYTQQLVAAVPGGRAHDGMPAGEPVVTATKLTKRFGSLVAVDAVSFGLRRGRTLGVVGESGSGKTTLARLTLALERPDAGAVELFGQPWTAVPERERTSRRARIGAIYQDALSSFDPRLTVRQILADALGGRPTTAELVTLVEQVGLDASVLPRHPRVLSGGQQQRVAIARAIAARPDVIVCDEPVSNLDVSVQAQVLALLDRLQRDLGLSYLFITHDLGVVRQVSDELLVMKNGSVVERGATETVFAAPQHPYTQALLAAVPDLRR
ncbi:ABC transporter ATP-binding protein [Lacisediminihabitans changchengi]|uniref:ABC transporter ATP-binding protein n=1 Tax=Lacisediminihabitans changchengi TaxID=2787634 RepID=UPI0027DCE52F|nr:ABC transporter ATP-binding protein [Lacisediminihabitans changchengi]